MDIKEELKTFRMRVETLKKETETLMIEINDIKISLIDNEEAQKVAKPKVQQLDTQLEAAQAKQRDMSIQRMQLYEGLNPSLNPYSFDAYARFFVNDVEIKFKE